jgi:hypothetical protein
MARTDEVNSVWRQNIALGDRFVHRASMAFLSRIIPDRFIWVLIATIAVASVLPVRGADVATANLVSSGAVFLIFLLHGIRSCSCLA